MRIMRVFFISAIGSGTTPVMMKIICSKLLDLTLLQTFHSSEGNLRVGVLAFILLYFKYFGIAEACSLLLINPRCILCLDNRYSKLMSCRELNCGKSRLLDRKLFHIFLCL